jgi:hypothetical protein
MMVKIPVEVIMLISILLSKAILLSMCSMMGCVALWCIYYVLLS